MNDFTAVETTDGIVLLVELDEAASVVRFSDEDGGPVAAYALDTFAAVTDALALDFGAGVVLNAETVAGVQQWARLD